MTAIQTSSSSFSWIYILVEIATLTRENGKTVFHILTQTEVEDLIKKYEEEQKEKEAEKTSKK